ncbi:MAG TPA: hypothetical protein VKV40_00065 [Ktedonobacteraceae bacterium]|nr:hypothetical protein [Ktedonobacteraceae bacterium]
MSQTQETGQEQGKNQSQEQPPVERADEALKRAGRNIGIFAGLAAVCIQRATGAVRNAAKPVPASNKKAEQPEVAQTEESATLAGEKATEQAEQMVDQAAQRLGTFAATLSYQAQKAAARLREEGEDIWFEAQHIRQQALHQENPHQQNEQK